MFGGRTPRSRKRIIGYLIAFMVLILILTLAALYLKIEYEITRVDVGESSHYTKEEIEKIVFDKPYTYNSVILNLKYHNKSINDVPFIERIDVDIVNPHEVRINVYEKAVAGYVEYLGHYMYFDKDGIVVESSKDTMDDVPLVTGLDFDYVVLYKALPVDDKKIFMQILNITQLLNKYEIRTDRIAFDSNKNVMLYFGGARVSIGSDDYIDEKINEMHLLLPQLEGYSGVLHMENYSGEEGNFSFDKDEVRQEVVEDEQSEEKADDNAESSDEAQ